MPRPNLGGRSPLGMASGTTSFSNTVEFSYVCYQRRLWLFDIAKRFPWTQIKLKEVKKEARTLLLPLSQTCESPKGKHHHLNNTRFADVVITGVAAIRTRPLFALQLPDCSLELCLEASLLDSLSIAFCWSGSPAVANRFRSDIDYIGSSFFLGLQDIVDAYGPSSWLKWIVFDVCFESLRNVSEQMDTRCSNDECVRPRMPSFAMCGTISIVMPEAETKRSRSKFSGRSLSVKKRISFHGPSLN